MGGQVFNYRIVSSAVRDGAGKIVAAIEMVEDITERKKMDEEIWHMAHHDALTGLPNRRLFLELMSFGLVEAHRNRTKAGLLFLDLDRFKEVNDMLGHEAGDALLKKVAERLTSAVREVDVVARLGGDEFSILLTGIEYPKNIIEIVRKILDALKKKCVIAGRTFRITTSVGISIYPDDSLDGHTLFRYADIAMYRAKDRGRNTFEFYNPNLLGSTSQDQVFTPLEKAADS
jgi:diguanylate cyclase (GGDEF)-like protein